MKYAVQFGAGNIGRGFMGQLFWEIGHKIVFVEADKDLVNAINKKGRYPLKLLDAYTKKEIDLEIDNLEAIHSKDIGNITDIITKADVICTAVGEKVLKDIAPVISSGLIKRSEISGKPIDIYLCENNLHAAEILKKEVIASTPIVSRDEVEAKTGFVGMVVSRMVPAASDRFGITDSLFAVADSYHKLHYDGKARKADPLPIEGMKPVDDFEAVFDRKLYTLNLTHAALGYLGFLKGYEYVHQPFEDKELDPIIEGAMEETSAALLDKYKGSLGAKEQKEIIKDTKIRFGNPLLMDSITRVARDPLRKLGNKDRLVGSANLCLEQDIYPENIAKICGAALNYDFSKDKSAIKMQGLISSDGIEKAMNEITGVDPESRFGKDVISSYKYFKRNRK